MSNRCIYNMRQRSYSCRNSSKYHYTNISSSLFMCSDRGLHKSTFTLSSLRSSPGLASTVLTRRPMSSGVSERLTWFRTMLTVAKAQVKAKWVAYLASIETSGIRKTLQSQMEGPSFASTVAGKFFFRLIRIVRVAFLGYATYIGGYNIGQFDYAKDPARTYEAHRLATAVAMGGTKVMDNRAVQQRFETIVSRVIESGRTRCRREIEKLEAKYSVCTQKLQDQAGEMTDEMFLIKRQIKMWKARRRILRQKWEVFLFKTQNEILNACVSPMCPRTIFVTADLATSELSDDEIAVLIGHEISHTILGHGVSKGQQEVLNKVVQLVVLSLIDPTGILTLAVASFMHSYAEKSKYEYSRECEFEADELGLELAAGACYDVEKGYTMATHLGDLMDPSGELSQKRTTAWNSTHPSFPERLERLEKVIERLSHDEDMKESCHHMTQKFLKRVFGGVLPIF